MKKLFRENKFIAVLVIVIIAAAVGTAVLCAAVYFGKGRSDNLQTASVGISDYEEESVPQVSCSTSHDGEIVYTFNGQACETRPHFLEDTREIIYNGTEYRRDSTKKAYLLLGIDSGDSLQKDYGLDDMGNADCQFLVSYDTTNGSVRILMIPRDTQTMIPVTDRNLVETAPRVDHINLAWGMGDGHEQSGEFMCRAVSWLTGGLTIDGYMAGPRTLISKLNDAIGGVTVTVTEKYLEEADADFKVGNTITLMGDKAERYVRYRNTNVSGSALERMKAQKSYAIAFQKQLIEKQQQDSDTIPNMMELLEGNIITDMDKGTYLRMAIDTVERGEVLDEESFLTVPGTAEFNNTYDEWHPDYMELDKIILSMFYTS